MDFAGFVPAFGGLAWTIIAFVFALSIIVFVHEFGHYIVGRWSGIHAEVFSLGFGPVLVARTDRHGTRWQLAALPFGGFVKFLGDANAASGKDDAAISQLSAAERRHTMHGAPLWARAVTVAAGPVFNFIFSILIFAGLGLFGGVATERTVVGQVADLPGIAEPLLPGDTILAINGTDTPDLTRFVEVAGDLPPAPTVAYDVLRDGQPRGIEGPFPLPPLVSFVQPGSAAAAAGMLTGDVVLTMDNQPMRSFNQMRELVGASGGREMALDIWRAGETISLRLTPIRSDVPIADAQFETRWLLGLSGGWAFDPETRTPGVFEAVGLGAERTWSTIVTSLSGLYHMVTGQISSCNLRGPVGIAETSGAAASLGILIFIGFIASLSTAVGLMNLFPIPILDGGHLVFHAYEAVAGRPPSERALRALMSAGLAFLITLMVLALSNDVFCP